VLKLHTSDRRTEGSNIVNVVLVRRSTRLRSYNEMNSIPKGGHLPHSMKRDKWDCQLPGEKNLSLLTNNKSTSQFTHVACSQGSTVPSPHTATPIIVKKLVVYQKSRTLSSRSGNWQNRLYLYFSKLPYPQARETPISTGGCSTTIDKRLVKFSNYFFHWSPGLGLLAGLMVPMASAGVPPHGKN
jgi:hypothetical protein